jgi:hypothetical protein
VRTWLVAALEIIGALILARVMVWTEPPGMQHGDHNMAMPGMASAPGPGAHWTWPVYGAVAVVVATGIWWLVSRQAVVAVICAVALLTCAVSQPVRVLATRSHLIAMVVLESLMVLIPLLVLTALPRPSKTRRSSARAWLSLTVGSALAYAALLVALHIPAVHRRGVELGAVPAWVALAAEVIGVGYWFGVLNTGTLVSVRVRRAALLGAQEVAAFIGLLSLCAAWGSAHHHSPVGIPAVWDQVLGGLVMMATCAAVAIPLARRMH